MNNNPAFGEIKARELATEAVKPNAPLMDISYAWEAIGKSAIPFLTPLMTNPQPDVQFAAARAAAFLDDPFGQDRLVQIACTSGDPFQINAIQALEEVSDDVQLDAKLAKLLDSDQAMVRIEAYKVLANHKSPYIYSKAIASPLNPENDFMLDMVNSDGPPLIYCTRLGVPRVAVFGRKVDLFTPVVFSAFDSHLTISTVPGKNDRVNVYYYDETQRKPVQAVSGRGVAELIARLGGSTDEGFHFTYGDVVTVLQALVDRKDVGASFVLQKLPQVDRPIQQAPLLPDEGRPQTTQPSEVQTEIGATLPDLRPTPTTNPAPGPQDGSTRPQ
jgi:hypothetical protein